MANILTAFRQELKKGSGLKTRSENLEDYRKKMEEELRDARGHLAELAKLSPTDGRVDGVLSKLAGRLQAYLFRVGVYRATSAGKRASRDEAPLRTALIKLAHENPDGIREHLLPLLRRDGAEGSHTSTSTG